MLYETSIQDVINKIFYAKQAQFQVSYEMVDRTRKQLNSPDIIERMQKTSVFHNLIIAFNNMENDFYEAAYNLKAEVRNYPYAVFDRNILIKEGNYYRLLAPNDFIHKKKAEVNRFYITIRDFLRLIERIKTHNRECEEKARNKEYKKTLSEKKEQEQERLLNTFIDFSVESLNIDESIKLLYELSLGDLKVVEDLAILASEIRKPSVITPTVILADGSVHWAVYKFLEIISAKSFPAVTYQRLILKEVLNIKELQGLAYCNWNNFPLSAVYVEDEIPEAESKVLKLKKIMNGKTVSINHPYFSGKLFVKNRIPFIYITQSHEKYLKMKNIYGAKGIKIPSKKVSQIYDKQHGNMWLQNNFAKFGLIKRTSKASASYLFPKITEDEIFSEFSKELCIFDSKSDCSTQELYETYALFFKSFYGDNPLTFRQFRTRFAIFSGLEDCRPHHSSTSNPRCFRGIKINTKRYSQLINSDTQIVLKCTEKEFAHRLLETMRKENCLTKSR